MKEFIVEFLPQGGARISKDPEEIASKKNNDNVLHEPNLSHVKTVSPAFWKLGKNKTIELMNEEEVKEKLESEQVVTAMRSKVKELGLHEFKSGLVQEIVAKVYSDYEFLGRMERISAQANDSLNKAKNAEETSRKNQIVNGQQDVAIYNLAQRANSLQMQLYVSLGVVFALVALCLYSIDKGGL